MAQQNKNGGRAMTLVERFIEINAWPTSKKSALLCVLGLCVALPLWAFIHFADSAAFKYLDKGVLGTVMGGWTLAHVVVLALSLLAMRRGDRGDWTAILFVMLMGLPFMTMIYLAGSFTSPFFALYPLATILLALWFGESTGWFSLVMGALTLTAFGILEARGVLPHAPLVLKPDLDADPLRALGRMAPVMVAFVYCFGLSVLIVAARKLQDQRLREAQQLIRRYVPSQVADAIISGRGAGTGRHERRKLSIFFSDLVGFTDISEELEPEDLSRVLNEYFSEMTAIAQKHGGTVDELSGDAILILFGAPHATDDKDHALRAVRMATEMQQAMPMLNSKWSKAGITETLQVRMGINTGVVTIGDFGSKDRMKYAALGKHVNLAARIQSHCEPGKVLISHATWLLVNDQIHCTAKGEKQFKGINKSVPIYELA